MLIGIIGKPSSGKTTILNAMCMTDAKTGNYPFTTIKPNRGVAYVQIECACKTINTTCNPRTGYCINKKRFIPIELLDVAGLVPGASSGKGMGNQFLDDLRQADIFIHVVDSSGTTDEEGNPVDNYDPINDIEWLNNELDAWVYSILFDNWDRLSRKLDADRTKIVESLQEKLSGLGASVQDVKKALKVTNLSDTNPRLWDENKKLQLSNKIRTLLFPMIIAANKNDKPGALNNIKKIKDKYPDLPVIATSGLAEYTLRTANERGLIDYSPGSNDFKVISKDDSKLLKTSLAIKEKILIPYGNTGVQQLLEHTVFNVLKMLAVFPVDDTTHLTDADGRVLPDVFLVPNGTTAKEFARKIHSDLADHFIHAIIVNKNHKRVSANYELDHGDIIKIVSSAK